MNKMYWDILKIHYLNTYHVKVQFRIIRAFKFNKKNLNTYHVKVQLEIILVCYQQELYLNTYHVKVQYIKSYLIALLNLI